jgi:hypothetical protein
MNSFTIGDRITDGAGRRGEISSGFHVRGGSKPKHGEVPVQWDDGDQTYVSPFHLQFEEF